MESVITFTEANIIYSNVNKLMQYYILKNYPCLNMNNEQWYKLLTKQHYLDCEIIKNISSLKLIGGWNSLNHRFRLWLCFLISTNFDLKRIEKVIARINRNDIYFGFASSTYIQAVKYLVKKNATKFFNKQERIERIDYVDDKILEDQCNKLLYYKNDFSFLDSMHRLYFELPFLKLMTMKNDYVDVVNSLTMYIKHHTYYLHLAQTRNDVFGLQCNMLTVTSSISLLDIILQRLEEKIKKRPTVNIYYAYLQILIHQMKYKDEKCLHRLIKYIANNLNMDYGFEDYFNLRYYKYITEKQKQYLDKLLIRYKAKQLLKKL